MKRWSLLALLAIVAGLGAVVLWQNSYDLDQRDVTIRQGGRTLQGVLSVPKDGKARHPLVVMIHGDSALDATHDGGYLPIWEAYGKAGYASLSWNKPGVGGAPGNWLDQSMDDRADEAAAAIAWARSRADIDSGHIGLWGSSQAGWVMPKIAQRTRVAFVIADSTAINWLRQGRYNLLATNPSPSAVAASDRVRGLLERKATYQEYVAVVGAEGAMTAERWAFVGKNHTADATADLVALRDVPVLLNLGGHDVNVDVADTEAVYRRQLAGKLAVHHYPDADHAMVRHELTSLRLTLVAVLAPRSLFASGYLDDQSAFLRSLPR